MLTVVETLVYAKQVDRLLTADEQRKLHTLLSMKPDAGEVIQDSDGMRKVRWGREGHGKSSGVRAIYYAVADEGAVYMLFMYPKSEQDDLKPDQLERLRRVLRIL